MTAAGLPRHAWLVTPLMALATYLGLSGIAPMLKDGPWRGSVAAVILVAMAAVLVTRRLTRSRLIPTAVGAALTLWVSVVTFARDDEGGRFWLPTPAALRELGSLMNEAVHHASTTVAPAPVTPALLALLTLSAVALFLVAEHLVASWRAAAVAGIVLVVPWVPAMALQYHLAVFALAGAMLCWLLALGLTTVWTQTDRSPGLAPVGVAAVSIVALGAIVTPLLLGGPGWGAFPRITAPQALDPTTRLNLDLDLHASLTTGSASPVLSYRSTGARPDVWRLATLTEFDGNSWHRENPEAIDLRYMPGAVMWPEPLSDFEWDSSEAAHLSVTIEALAETNLPVPAVPRLIDAPGSWRYAPAFDEVVGEDSTLGLTYEVYAALGHLDASRLAGMDSLPAVDLERGIGAEYTTLPEAVDLERITRLAQQITADATTRYDKALAIQTYLRDPIAFTYDTAVEPRGADAVSTFLDQRRGYCVQFATTMVVMLRALDIPARLGVGFLSGSPASEGRYVVKGADAHTWPEVFFPTVGWVRFEPTPAAQTGMTPTYADPQSTEVEIPDSVRAAADAQQRGEPRPDPSAPSATTPATTAPHPTETSDTPGGTSTAPDTPAQTGPRWLLPTVLGLLVAALAAVVWWLRRRRTARPLDTEGAWRLLRDGLDPTWRWPTTLTPLEVPGHLAQRWEEAGLVLDPVVHRGVAFLATLVSDSRYAVHSDEVSEEGLAALVETVVLQVEAAQRAVKAAKPNGAARTSERRRGDGA